MFLPVQVTSPSAAITILVAGALPLPSVSLVNTSSRTETGQPSKNGKASPPTDGPGLDVIQDPKTSIVGNVPDIDGSFAVGSQVLGMRTLQSTRNPRWEVSSHFVLSPEGSRAGARGV